MTFEIKTAASEASIVKSVRDVVRSVDKICRSLTFVHRPSKSTQRSLASGCSRR